MATYFCADPRFSRRPGCGSLWERRTIADRTVAGDRAGTSARASTSTSTSARAGTCTRTGPRAGAIGTRQAGDRDYPESRPLEQSAD